MSDQEITLTRQELYREVWKEPITRVAERYGLSDVGLAKICRQLRVPTPPRGYWARLQHGYKVVRTPLLSPGKGVEETYTIRPRDPAASSSRKKEREERRERLEEELDLGKPIRVTGRLRNPHPLVEKTRNALMGMRPDDHGILRLCDGRGIDIRVTPGMMGRAMRILDTVIKAMEERGFPARLREEWDRVSFFMVRGEELFFSLEERLKQIPHVLTADEKEREKRYGSSNAHMYDYVLTGVFALRLKEFWGKRLKKTWSDTKRLQLEEQINDFIMGAVMVAERKTVELEEHRAEERRREEERIRREEELRRQQLERERLEVLEKEAECWARSQQLREYIAAVQKKIVWYAVGSVQRRRIEEWVAWAEGYADRLDPVPFRLTLRDEVIWPTAD